MTLRVVLPDSVSSETSGVRWSALEGGGLPRRYDPPHLTAEAFEGVPIRGLTFGLVAIYPPVSPDRLITAGWCGPDSWGCFSHPGFEDLWLRYDPSFRESILTQRFWRVPNLEAVAAAAGTVFGSIKPRRLVGLPARYRLPLACDVRSADLSRGAPVPGVDAREVDILGIDCTTRLSWTTIFGRPIQLWSELFIGSTISGDGIERSMLYAADAYRARRALSAAPEHFLAAAIDRLVSEAIDACTRFDVVPLSGDRSRHPRVATLHSAGRYIVADVNRRLPGITPRFAVVPFHPNVRVVRSTRELKTILGQIRRGNR